MLRDLSVLPGLGGTNLVRAGVADDFDESVHVLVIAELYEEFQDILRSQRPYHPRKIRLRGARRRGDCRVCANAPPSRNEAFIGPYKWVYLSIS